jgi:virulence-associated protein VapD
MSNDICPESEFGHRWVAGSMYVHDEDVATVARARQVFRQTVECEKCEHVYEVLGGKWS